MRRIEISEKRKILFDMLVEIDRFCKKNKIEYFLVGGTLLGAIRHNGFIPWDDDIDIGMKRFHYERFLQTYTSISGNIDIINISNNDKYLWPAAKAVDKRTILIENCHNKNAIGVFIDIFPFDTVAGSYDQVAMKQKQIQKWTDLLSLRTLVVNEKRVFWKNAIIVACGLLKVIPSKTIINHIEKMSRKDEDKNCTYICNFAGAWGKREIAKLEYFTSVEDHRFESGNFSIPVGYDDYLKTVYGDYMKLPPIEKRISHHCNVAYWKE